MADVTVDFFRQGSRNMIRQVMAGSHGGENVRKVRPEDVDRWPVEWAQYQGMDVSIHDGTPLEDVPGMSARLALGFRLMSIRNAEALAETSDAVIQNVLGGLGMRNAAQLLVESNRHKEAWQRDRKEMNDLKAQIAELKAQQSQPERRGPGRPRKEEAGADA